jgi:hypothetical protein
MFYLNIFKIDQVLLLGPRCSRRLGEGSRGDTSSLHVRLRGAGDIRQNGWRGCPDTGLHPDVGALTVDSIRWQQLHYTHINAIVSPKSTND